MGYTMLCLSFNSFQSNSNNNPPGVPPNHTDNSSSDFISVALPLLLRGNDVDDLDCEIFQMEGEYYDHSWFHLHNDI